jgi:hypothetical protein
VYYEPPPAPVHQRGDEACWTWLIVGFAAGLLLGLLLLPRPKGPDIKKLNDEIDKAVEDLKAQARRFVRPEAEAALEETGNRLRAILLAHKLRQ